MPRIYSLSPDSTRQKTAIFYALEAGYRFKLTDEDGIAIITTPEGNNTYDIHQWQCDCADAINRDGGSYILPDERRVCKHVLWLSQLYPCPHCNGFMVLRADETQKHFSCTTPACNTIEAFQKVKSERQQMFRQREQEADVIKTHTPQDVDDILAKAEAASSAIFGD